MVYVNLKFALAIVVCFCKAKLSFYANIGGSVNDYDLLARC